MSTGVARVYEALLRTRLRDHACEACGCSLEAAAVVSSADGTTLEEYGLSERSSLEVLAATEYLTVRCEACGATSRVGTPLTQLPEGRTLGAKDLAQWSLGAISAYQSAIRARLENRGCGSCNEPLRSASIELATGGSTLPEWDLGDESVATALAWTHRLSVRCSRCGTVTTV